LIEPLDFARASLVLYVASIDNTKPLYIALSTFSSLIVHTQFKIWPSKIRFLLPLPQARRDV